MKSRSGPEKKRADTRGGSRSKRSRSRRGRPETKAQKVTPAKVDPRLEAILARIGVPQEAPFKADPFQSKSLRLLQRTDVLVTAPTGAGKTWIAVEAIRECLNSGGRAWYACPLKALSNAKFEEFSDVFGPDAVGILTGDRKENAVAPLIVGTTEILRNQLYDTMSESSRLPCELVILDEAHYLSEPERGVVWEETLIYVPSDTRLLLLSATIQNAQEIAEWLTAIRGVTCSVVAAFERPVSLYPLFLYPDGSIGLLSGRKGLTRDVTRYLQSISGNKGRGRGGLRPPRWNFSRIIGNLRRYNLLPALFFLKSRAECDRMVTQCRRAPRTPEAQAAFEKDLNECLERFPYLQNHRALHDMVSCRAASHHAGHLPFWKVLVEQMMLKGHLDAIFATSTVAGGVNFPARTVVLVQSDRYNGKEFQSLSATDLQQMIGRAGRRGKDEVGFALVVPGPYQDPKLIHKRLRSPPDPIVSQIRINFSMVLNLLQSHSPEGVRTIIHKSLAAFQQTGRYEQGGPEDAERKQEVKRADVREKLWEDFLRHKDFLQETGFVDKENDLTWEGRCAAQLRLDHPVLVAEAIRAGSFEGVSPAILAGMIATFVVEGDRREELEGELRVSHRDLSKRITRMKRDLKDLIRLLKRRGFDAPEIPLWPAAAIYLWAKGVSWEALLRTVSLEDGDMAMMIIRTADHLNQFVGLRASHPGLAEVADMAVPLILREPVWV